MCKEFGPEDEAEMVRLYEAERMTMRDIADRCGMGYNRVRNILISRGIHLRDRYERSDCYEPTSEEIEATTAEIRRGWDKTTRKTRRVSGIPAPLTVPIIHMPPCNNGKQLRVI